MSGKDGPSSSAPSSEETSADRSAARAPESRADLGLVAAARGFTAGEFRSIDLVEACIERTRVLDPLLNAYVTIDMDGARRQAEDADRERRAGRPMGPLHGVPISLKDNIDTAGMRTTAGSRLYERRVPDRDADLVTRLRAAGAIILGKASLHEFALGPTSASTGFGPVRNPWNPAFCAGGSSGGSAAGVAARLCFASIGTDTGGSIRNPAAWCGIVGFKPTYGLVSTRGVIPVVSSLDHCGPMTRDVADAELLLRVIADIAPPAADPAASRTGRVASLRVGKPQGRFFADIDPEIAASVDVALALIAGMTAGVEGVELPATCDCHLISERDAFHKASWVASAGLYTPDARARLSGMGIGGSTVDYRRSIERLRGLRMVAEPFDRCDVVVLPTVRRQPLPLAETLDRENRGQPTSNADISNGAAFNYYGGPAINIPCGLSAAGMPIGLTIAGPPGADALVLALAHAYEATAGLDLRPRL